jgi:MFS family permease
MVVGSRPPAPEVTVRQGIGRGRAGDRYAIGDVPNRLAKRLALLAMCFGLFMAMLDNIIVNVALPSIQARFGASVSGLEWVVTAHTSPFACLLLTAGLIADAKGRSSCSWQDWRCSSAACALAPDMTRAGDRPVHCSVRQRRRCSPARCRSSGNGLIRRHPATLAQAFVTLDHLTEGRAILGVGSGERENTEPCGMPFVNRVSRLEEAPPSPPS